MNSSFRKIENFHILLWLLKDLFWVTLSETAGIVMIAPTLLLAIYITYIHRAEKAELAHNLAVCMWITANSIWMIGEFYFEDTLRGYATIFFIAGLSIMLLYYLPLIFRKKLFVDKKKDDFLIKKNS